MFEAEFSCTIIYNNYQLTPEPAAGMEVAALEGKSPNGVGGKKRPTEALLPTYGIGLLTKGYNGQPVSCPK